MFSTLSFSLHHSASSASFYFKEEEATAGGLNSMTFLVTSTSSHIGIMTYVGLHTLLDYIFHVYFLYFWEEFSERFVEPQCCWK